MTFEIPVRWHSEAVDYVTTAHDGHPSLVLVSTAKSTLPVILGLEKTDKLW